MRDESSQCKRRNGTKQCKKHCQHLTTYKNWGVNYGFDELTCQPLEGHAWVCTGENEGLIRSQKEECWIDR